MPQKSPFVKFSWSLSTIHVINFGCIYLFFALQIPMLPRCYREKDREQRQLRGESEPEEEEERFFFKVSDDEESDDTAYDRRHAIPSDLP